MDFALYEEKEAVRGIRENRVCATLSKKIDDAYTDDNGAYLNSRSTKRMYHVDIDKKSMTVSSHVVHDEGGAYYCNQRCGGCAYERVVVSENEVYFLERYYRESKSVPGLKRMVVRAKSISTQSYEKHSCIVYPRKSVCRDEEVEILAHGNALKADRRSYICTLSKVLQEDEELQTQVIFSLIVFLVYFSSYIEFSSIKLLMSAPILVAFAYKFRLESDVD